MPCYRCRPAVPTNTSASSSTRATGDQKVERFRVGEEAETQESAGLRLAFAVSCLVHPLSEEKALWDEESGEGPIEGTLQ